MQDALIRRNGLYELYQAMRKHGNEIEKKRRHLVRVGLSMLAAWTGDNLRVPGESNTGRGPVPRSTLCYWLRSLMRLKLIVSWDEATNSAASPRSRGDGRHKTTWVVHSFDYALQLLFEDPNVATPKGRCFWVLNGRPLTTAEAVDWKLDVALAERLPAAWECNARRWNPDAPMKPTGKEKKLRAASAAEIATILDELCGQWKIEMSHRQAADIFDWARDDQPDINAEGLAKAISDALHKETAIQRRKDRYGKLPGFTVGWLSRERIRGIANRWHSAELLRVAEEARAARIAAEHRARAAVLAEPPPGD
jgi:hypothetical protein